MHLITAQEVVGLNPTEVTKGLAEMLFPFLFIINAIINANDIFLAFITCFFMLILSKIITFLYNIGL